MDGENGGGCCNHNDQHDNHVEPGKRAEASELPVEEAADCCCCCCCCGGGAKDKATFRPYDHARDSSAGRSSR